MIAAAAVRSLIRVASGEQGENAIGIVPFLGRVSQNLQAAGLQDRCRVLSPIGPAGGALRFSARRSSGRRGELPIFPLEGATVRGKPEEVTQSGRNLAAGPKGGRKRRDQLIQGRAGE